MLVAILIVSAIPVLAENTNFRCFLIGGKKLSNNWSLTSVNFMIKSATSTNFWSFAGPRYKWNGGKNFVDFFAGCQFTDGQKGLFAISPRFNFSISRFSIWQDIEWYLSPNSFYTESKVMLVIPKTSGLELGLDVSSFTPAPGKETIWNVGPNIEYGISNQMGIGLTWQFQQEKFGGNYIMFTTSLFFF